MSLSDSVKQMELRKQWEAYFTRLKKKTKCNMYVAYGAAVQVVVHSDMVFEGGKLEEVQIVTEAFEKVYREAVGGKERE